MQNNQNDTALVNIITKAIQIPGVKVNRDAFLKSVFKDEKPQKIEEIIEKGPIAAKYDRKKLKAHANKLINERTLLSSGASFAAGIPGGIAMAATIPADLLQFYGVALRMAQELAYLYGEDDLWENQTIDNQKVRNQLILYCGVMLGATGAAQTVRVMARALAGAALKKLPQKALMKTFYYPIIKSIAKFFGKTMTKSIFAKGVSKAIPIVGGVISGGITFFSLRPMGNRLANTLDEAHFAYTDVKYQADLNDIENIVEKEGAIEAEFTEAPPAAKNVLEQIKDAKDLLDNGIISDAEFESIKEKLISQM